VGSASRSERFLFVGEVCDPHEFKWVSVVGGCGGFDLFGVGSGSFLPTGNGRFADTESVGDILLGAVAIDFGEGHEAAIPG
jgi:hypothetical protein